MSTASFRSRVELTAVPGFGPKTFEQAAGFLRIRGGENPLDMTAVHPESYPVVEKIAASLGVTVADLIAKPELVEKVKLEGFATETVGMYTLGDIREELRKPGRDPREKFVAPHWREDVKEIADLKPGMTLEGRGHQRHALRRLRRHRRPPGRPGARERAIATASSRTPSEVVKVGPDRQGAGAERRPQSQAHRAFHESAGSGATSETGTAKALDPGSAGVLEFEVPREVGQFGGN